MFSMHPLMHQGTHVLTEHTVLWSESAVMGTNSEASGDECARVRAASCKLQRHVFAYLQMVEGS